MAWTSPRGRGLRSPGLALLVGFSIACSSLGRRGSSEVRPEAGAVVAEHPLAVEVGLEILDRGGNAADAAVATALALAVVYPQAGNLGGGGFALWVPRSGAPTSFDFREQAPANADPADYLLEDGSVDRRRSLYTPLAVGVPGSPAGLAALHAAHGSGELSFAELCEPAIRLARDGFTVDPWLARAVEGRKELLGADPAARAIFLPDGEPLREGDLWRQDDLADTLQRLADEGPDRGFYSGPVARAFVSSLEAAQVRTAVPAAGPELDDLRRYRVAKREPLIGRFQGHEVITMGPPSSGGLVLLQVLSVLQGMPLAAEVDEQGAPTARALHWWIEALRRAFADRARHMGDPDHYPVPVEALLDPAWIAERRVSISDSADLSVQPLALPGEADSHRALPPPESPETTHLSVIDRRGNAVSLTTTLNSSFGSGIVVDGCGFLLNNELDDFSVQAGTPNLYGLVGGEANQLRAGRRPLSSMTPSVVRKDGIRLVIGAPGGPRIITAVFQVLLRHLQYGQPLDVAVPAPRLHQQWRPEVTRFEEDFPKALWLELRDQHGQPVQDPARAGFGSVQAISIDGRGQVRAVSDPRRGGIGGVQGRALPDPATPR